MADFSPSLGRDIVRLCILESTLSTVLYADRYGTQSINMLPGLDDKNRWIAVLQAAIIALILGHGYVIRSIAAVICSGSRTK